MKLLDPKENKDNKDEQTLRTIIRTQELQKVEQKARQDLANSQAEFNLMLAKNRDKWANEEAEHFARVKEMEKELAELEVKKLNFLIPFNILENGTLERLGDAETYLKFLKEREEYNEDLTEKLQDKLDEVGGKEQDLKQRELELNIRETGLENQSQTTIQRTQRLSEEIARFSMEKREAEKEIKEKRDSLSLLEQSLNQQETEVRQIQKANNEQAIRLADERGVLDRAWRELERKKAR